MVAKKSDEKTIESEDKAKMVAARYKAALDERTFHDPMVRQALSYELPQKAGFSEEVDHHASSQSFMNDLYDMTASRANNTLSSGQVSEMTPITDTWFAFVPEDSLSEEREISEAEKNWHEKNTKIVMRELEKAGFYAQINEVFLERNVACTGTISTMEGKKNVLNFRAHDWGSYVIGEDDERNVNYLGRKFKLNADNAARKFGKENLPEKIQELIGNVKKANEKFVFIHEILERSENERKVGKIDGVNKPWASRYICEKPLHFISEGGFEEQPFGCSRFSRRPGHIYGWGPGLESLPLVRRANFLTKLNDVLVETQANPRILAPAAYEDAMDLRAGMVSPMDENSRNIPQAWATEGSNRDLKETLDGIKEEIRDIFYNDLFQLLAGIDPGKMTAYETMQRLAEKLNKFAPTFQLITTELLAPTLTRAYNICLRAGIFPEPPEEAYVPIGVDEAGNHLSGIVAPKVVFSSKIALAMKALENRAFLDFIQMMLPLFHEFPEMKDNLNSDEVFRKMARDMGVAFSLAEEKEVEQIRNTRAEQVKAEQALAAGESVSKTVEQLGNAPQEIQEQATQALSAG